MLLLLVQQFGFLLSFQMIKSFIFVLLGLPKPLAALYVQFRKKVFHTIEWHMMVTHTFQLMESSLSLSLSPIYPQPLAPPYFQPLPHVFFLPCRSLRRCTTSFLAHGFSRTRTSLFCSRVPFQAAQPSSTSAQVFFSLFSVFFQRATSFFFVHGSFLSSPLVQAGSTSVAFSKAFFSIPD